MPSCNFLIAAEDAKTLNLDEILICATLYGLFYMNQIQQRFKQSNIKISNLAAYLKGAVKLLQHVTQNHKYVA